MFVPVTVVVILIFTAMGSVVSDTYKKGGVAVLSPGSVSGPITNIVWKHGPHMAVDWYGEETIEYRDFSGRCELNTNTGTLRISNLSLNDSGIYTAEINHRITGMTDITVIAAVPKPTISTQCNPEKTQCILTCEASITTDTGPVNYTWETGDRQRPSSSKQLDIAKDDPKMIGQPISCQLENPVSRERSDVIMSPFMNKSSGSVNPAAVIVPIVLIVLIVVLAGLVFLHKRRPENAQKSWSEYLAGFDPRSCLNRGGAPSPQPQSNGVEKREGTKEEGIPLVIVHNNGDAPDLSVQEPSCSTVVPTFYSPNTAAFSVANETHNQEQSLGSPDAKNETPTTSVNQAVTNYGQPGPVPTFTNDEAENQTGSSQTPADARDPSSGAENQTGSNQTPADSEDLSSGAETSAVASKTEETLKHHPLQEDDTAGDSS